MSVRIARSTRCLVSRTQNAFARRALSTNNAATAAASKATPGLQTAKKDGDTARAEEEKKEEEFTTPPLSEDFKNLFKRKDKAPLKTRIRHAWPVTRLQLAMGAATAVAGGLLWAGYETVQTLDETDRPALALTGFGVGLATAAACGAAIMTAQHMLAKVPPGAYKRLRKQALGNPKLAEALGGGPVRGSSYRSVRITPGGPRLIPERGVTYFGWERYWRPRTLNIEFGVRGASNPGLVKAEVATFYIGYERPRYIHLHTLPSGSGASAAGAGEAPKTAAAAQKVVLVENKG